MWIREIGEFGLIERLARKLPQNGSGVIVGIGDDAAVLRGREGYETVMTTDMLVEGVHFLPETIPYRPLGWKMMAASLSDVAAMGGIPRHAVISLAIPPQLEVEALDDLYEGVADICRRYDTAIVGGDVVKTDDRLVLSVTLLGEVERGRALLRSGAQPGDVVFVSGTVGGSAAGLVFLQRIGRDKLGQGEILSHPLTPEEQAALLRFHQRPEPQVRLGRLLALSGQCTSCNDISDGLASELNEIASSSGVCLMIEEASLPLHPAVQKLAQAVGENPLFYALYGGEDYQLVGTARGETFPALAAQAQRKGVVLHAIGQVQSGKGVFLRRAHGGEERLEAKGFNHFGGGDAPCGH